MSLDSVPVVDAQGGAFDLMRSLRLPMGLWHVPTADDVRETTPVPLLMLAVYSGAELDEAHALLRRTPTLVVGMGMGPREGPRALQLGAVGYMHDAQAPVELRDLIDESLLRAQRRRSRDSS